MFWPIIKINFYSDSTETHQYDDSDLPESTACISLSVPSGEKSGAIKNCANLKIR